MRHLTIRNVSPELGLRLEEEKRLRGRSLNQTVLDVLSQALGVDRSRRGNGLAQLAGGWSAAEHEEFERAITGPEQIDEELWR